MEAFLRGALICCILGLFCYCFKKVDKAGAKLRIFVLIGAGIALSLLSLIPASMDGNSGEDMVAIMFSVFFVYLLVVGWRIVADIVRLCKGTLPDKIEEKIEKDNNTENKNGKQKMK